MRARPALPSDADRAPIAREIARCRERRSLNVVGPDANSMEQRSLTKRGREVTVDQPESPAMNRGQQ